MSLSLKCALRESGCRIGYQPTKNELRLLSISRDTNVEVSALSPCIPLSESLANRTVARALLLLLSIYLQFTLHSFICIESKLQLVQANF